MMTEKKAKLTRWMDRRGMMVLGLVMLLLLSCYVGARPKSSSTKVSLPVTRIQQPQATAFPAPVTSVDPSAGFDVYRNVLDATRANALQTLDALIADTDADKVTVAQARTQKLELVRTMDLEGTLEGVLKARGFREILVTVRKGSVNIVLRREKLTSEEAAQILELAARETGENARNIKIVATK